MKGVEGLYRIEGGVDVVVEERLARGGCQCHSHLDETARVERRLEESESLQAGLL